MTYWNTYPSYLWPPQSGRERKRMQSVTIIGVACCTCCTCCFRLTLLQFVVVDATVCFGLNYHSFEWLAYLWVHKLCAWWKNLNRSFTCHDNSKTIVLPSADHLAHALQTTLVTPPTTTTITTIFNNQSSTQMSGMHMDKFTRWRPRPMDEQEC